MSNLGTHSEQAREAARQDNGRFGSYGAGESGASLSVAPIQAIRGDADLLAPRDAEADIAEAREAIENLDVEVHFTKVNYTRAMAKLAATADGRAAVASDPDHYLHDGGYDGKGLQAREVFDANAEHYGKREHAIAALRASGVGQNTRELTAKDVQQYPVTSLVESFKFGHGAKDPDQLLDPEHMRVYHHADDHSVGLRPERVGDFTFINTDSGSTSTGTFLRTADARIDDQGNVITVSRDPAQSVEMVLRPVDETPKSSATKTLEGIRNGRRGEIKGVNTLATEHLLTPGRRVTLHNPLGRNRMPKKSRSQHTGRIIDSTTSDVHIMDDKGDQHTVPKPSTTGQKRHSWTLDRNDRLSTAHDHVGSGEQVTWKIEFDQDEPSPND